MSHPSRDAWIEIALRDRYGNRPKRRIPRGMRGLKSRAPAHTRIPAARRIPRGMRGLKYCAIADRYLPRMSHPSRDAWIEIHRNPLWPLSPLMSHPSRDAWIEIHRPAIHQNCTLSHPSRDAWIEIIFSVSVSML